MPFLKYLRNTALGERHDQQEGTKQAAVTIGFEQSVGRIWPEYRRATLVVHAKARGDTRVDGRQHVEAFI